MSMPLLHTKLMPPRMHASIVARPQLLERLDEGLGKKLTLISAPTGFGKTTLVSTWLVERKIPTAWVALDANDNDPVRFWTYVVTALRALDPEVGRAALSALAAPQLPAFQTILTSLINELAGLSSACVLVLEDYHSISAAEIHADLAFFLQNLPGSLHLVLIARAEPDLPLGILRARDELVEINASDLRFDRTETESFLRQALSGDISPSAAERLQEHTEGWAAGLRLAALSLQNKGGEAAERVLESFSGSHRFVADYLIREVFANQPENIQSFLLKTCFLNRLTGGLCEAVTESSTGESILEQLERENLFLVQLEHGHGRSWYRYNPLFAESMQVLARQRLGEMGIQAVFERASAWYAYQQLYAEAIETALAAGLFERAIGLIETFVEIYSLNEMFTLTRWIERIPAALILRSPETCIAYAQVILFTYDRYAPATAARIAPYLEAAEKIWAERGEVGRVGAVLGMRGMMLVWQGELQQALDYAYRALEKLPESDIFWRGICLLNIAAAEVYVGGVLSAQDKLLEARALLGASQNIHGSLAATGILSEIFFAQGDLELCAELCQQLMAEAVGDPSMLDDQGSARLVLANVAYERNELERAERYASEALDLAEQRANELLQVQALSCLALICAARGEPARDRLRALAARLQSQLALRELRETEALLAVRMGEPPAAWLASNHPELLSQKEREAFIWARQRISEKQSAEALELINPYLSDAAEHGRVRSQVEALCLKALAQQAAGELHQAGLTLTHALTIGNEKGFRRLFLDEGASMALLVQEILPRLTKPVLRLYATTLLHLFSPNDVSTSQDVNSPQALVEPLSQQEARVLKLLVAGLSNGEIASELIVSTNTVKTHVKSIYRKLNIRSREEARVVVKELKLT